MILTDYLSFTEWYHYVLLLLWLILLFTGVKYYYLLESNFKVKGSFNKGEKSGKTMLTLSFTAGLLIVIIFTFKPAQINEQSGLIWDYTKYLMYGLLLLLLALNAYVSIKNYIPKSAIIRLISLTLMMLLYFYTGMLGGLLVLATFALFILIYSIIKFKNILSIK